MAEIDELQIRLLRARLAEATKANDTPVIDPETMTPEQRARLPVPSVSSAISAAQDVASNIRQAGKDVGEAGSEFISRGGKMLAHGVEAVVPPGTSARAWAENQRQLLERASQRRKERFEKERVGTGIGEFGREVLTTLPALAIPGGGATLPARLATGAVQGGAAGALGPPPASGNYLPQVATGAATGAAVPLATGAAARMVSPRASTDPNIQALLKEGVTPTTPQLVGGAVKGMEDRIRGLPIVGDAIMGARTRELQNLNRAAINRSLTPIGEKLPEKVDVGREGVTYAQQKISAAYDDLLPRLNATVDRQFANDIARLRSEVPASQVAEYERLLQRALADRSVGRQWTGEELKKAESELGNFAKRYRTSGDATQRDLGDAVSETQQAFRRLVERNNPRERGRLQNINRAYANLAIIERAAAFRATDEGLFSPTHLSAAVRAQDASTRKRRFAGGRALMQDLADPAQSILSSRAGNPGTAGTLVSSAGLMGTGAGLIADPITTLGVLGGLTAGSFGAYSPFAQRHLAAAMARRPAGAPALAQSVRNLSPFLTPPAVAGNPWESWNQ